MNQPFELNMSRLFKCSQETLFNAIAEGILFKKTGTLDDKSTFDFRVGGKLHLELGDNEVVDGERILEVAQLAACELGLARAKHAVEVVEVAQAELMVTRVETREHVAG